MSAISGRIRRIGTEVVQGLRDRRFESNLNFNNTVMDVRNIFLKNDFLDVHKK